MPRNAHKLSRRMLLRGAGSIAIGLPFLPELMPRAQAKGDDGIPCRLFTLSFGLGIFVIIVRAIVVHALGCVWIDMTLSGVIPHHFLHPPECSRDNSVFQPSDTEFRSVVSGVGHCGELSVKSSAGRITRNPPRGGWCP